MPTRAELLAGVTAHAVRAVDAEQVIDEAVNELRAERRRRHTR